DATVPVSLYDPYGLETGAGLLLPDGRAFFIGSTGHTAYYTPSGNTSPGSWAAGPDFPSGQGAPDAPASMLVDGKVLCAVSPKPTSGNHFPTPTSYYEFNYLTNTYTQVSAPAGGLTSPVSAYVTNMLTLPDGKVLFSFQGVATYYVYTPAGAPIAAGAPTLSTVKKNAGSKTYRITGKLFNGISEGTAYGDDWQMATNYPIVRFKSGANVYYGRTSNWNSTGVRRGIKADTATFTLPASMPSGVYSLVVIANGFSSNVLSFTRPAPSPADAAIIADAAADDDVSASVVTATAVYPNPAKSNTNIQFTLAEATSVSLKVVDMSGKELISVLNANMQPGYHSTPVNTSSLKPGVYLVRMVTVNSIKTMKLVIQ
ncbi:MAG TPA: T9SS type A sorting domain-containing protein, partial [Panacibacter sp.]|nr:T9SS type A sorting domain-containing protein [Panacibacter sp.]